MKKNKQTKHKPILKRNPIVRELVEKPKRNVGRHKNKNRNELPLEDLTNVRNKVVDVSDL